MGKKQPDTKKSSIQPVGLFITPTTQHINIDLGI